MNERSQILKPYLIQFGLSSGMSFLIFAVLLVVFKLNVNETLLFTACIIYFFVVSLFFTIKSSAPNPCSIYHSIKPVKKSFHEVYIKNHFNSGTLFAYIIPPSLMLLLSFFS